MGKGRMYSHVKKIEKLTVKGINLDDNCPNCGYVLKYGKNGMFFEVWCPSCEKKRARDFSLNNAIMEFKIA